MLSGEATNINFIVFGLTRLGLELTIYRTRGEHANHYFTDAVRIIRSCMDAVETHIHVIKGPSKQSDVGKTLSQRYALRSDNVILLHRHNVLLWTPQHVNTTIHTKSSQRNITTLS
jgi:hypothetical protein